MRRALVSLCGLAAVLLVSAAAEAHRSGVSTVRIDVVGEEVTTELAVKGIDLDAAIGAAIVDRETDTVRPPALAALADRAVAHLVANAYVAHADGERCEAAPEALIADADGVLLAVVWRCEPGRGILYRNRLFLQGETLAIQNVLALQGDEASQDVLTAEHDTFVLGEPPPGALAVIGRYTRSGVAHIAIGYDHIAFIVALLLWARRFWPVAKVVTAFTVAHSITLALAALDIVALPGSLVEPLIAASIVWVAVENFIWRDVARRWKIRLRARPRARFRLRGGAARIRPAVGRAGLGARFLQRSGWRIGQIVIVAVAVPALALLDRLTGGERDRRIVFAASGRHRRAGRVVARLRAL